MVFHQEGLWWHSKQNLQLSIILDLHLVIENKFYEEACQNQEQEPDVKVGKDSTLIIYLLSCYRIQHFRLSQENPLHSLK